jgi:hypothetical protein
VLVFRVGFHTSLDPPNASRTITAFQVYTLRRCAYYTIFPRTLQDSTPPRGSFAALLIGGSGACPRPLLSPRQKCRGSVPRASVRYRPLVLMVKLCLTKSTAAHFSASLLDEIGLTLGSFWVDAWDQLDRSSHEKGIRTCPICNSHMCKKLNAHVRI